jgi:hypothetical protein
MFLNSIMFLVRLAITSLWTNRQRYWVYVRARGKPLRFAIDARTKAEVEDRLRQLGFPDEEIL